MRAKRTAVDHAKDASQAMCQLYVMNCVVSMLEGGNVRGADVASHRMIAIAKVEIQRQLSIYDRAIARVAKDTP